MVDEPEELPEGLEEPAGRRKLWIIVISILLLVGITTGVAFLFIDDESADVEVTLEEEKNNRKDPIYIELKPFTVNLGPDDPVGFLQVQIQVLTYDQDVSEGLEKHKPMIRNNLTILFGEQKSSALRSGEGKLKLQSDILDSIQQIIDQYGSGGMVENVFFTNFVMQ